MFKAVDFFYFHHTSFLVHYSSQKHAKSFLDSASNSNGSLNCITLIFQFCHIIRYDCFLIFSSVSVFCSLPYSRYILYLVEAPLTDNKRSLLIIMECGVSWFTFMWLIICFRATILIICLLLSRTWL